VKKSRKLFSGRGNLYRAALEVYAKKHDVTLEKALEIAIAGSRGKPDADGQIRRYRRAYEELKGEE